MLSLPRNGQQQLDNVQQMVPPPPPSPHVMPYVTSPALSPIPLYPTGKAALVPTPMAYELIPNRIFVGGFPTSTTETELREHFDAFFPVKDVKMVKSLDGVSKGYGFITFETEDQAEAIRKLNPKQLEFRNRKLNLGPAIRNINANIFPPNFPGYFITTPSPSPFVPSPYSLPGSPHQVFVYPSVVANPEVKSPSDSPQLSPQQGQVFFPEQQEPVRTYANAVTVLPGVEKSAEPEQQGSPSQQSSAPNAQQPQYQQPWNGPEIVELPAQEGAQGQYPTYPMNGNEKGQYQPMQLQMPVYFPGQHGMYQPGVTYLTPPPFPLMQTPYYAPQQQAPQQVPFNQQNNGYVGPAGDFNNQEMYYGGNGYQGGYHEENNSFRPLQAPRAGKKNRKTSERMNNGGSHEKSGYQPVPMQLYMNSQGMYQQSMNYVPPYTMQQPYWIQPPQHQNFGYNNNNNGHHHHQNHHNNNGYDGQQQQQEVYYGGYQGNGGYHGGNDENAFPRPLQAASGKKSWKENLEKKKSPSKGSRSDKSSPSSRTTSTSSPTAATNSPSKTASSASKSPIPPLTDSMQSLTVESSPTKN